MKKYVIATMNSNEIDINEYIVHHILIGFEHIYIYDDHSNPNIKDIICELPSEYSNCVTIYRLDSHYEIKVQDYENTPVEGLLYFDKELYKKHKNNKQRYLFNYFIKTHKDKVKYCLFSDIDEFIYLKNHETIDEYMKSMSEYDYIQIPWVYYGTSYYINNPEGLVIDNFRFHSPCYDCSKCIVNIQKVEYMNCIHEINNKNHTNSYIYDIKQPLFTHDIHINHYITKSYKSVLTKKREHCLGNVNDFQRTTWQIISLYISGLNRETNDHIMKKYVDRINHILKYTLNTNHLTEKEDYLHAKNMSMFLNNNELTMDFVNNYKGDIINDILICDNVAYKNK